MYLRQTKRETIAARERARRRQGGEEAKRRVCRSAGTHVKET